MTISRVGANAGYRVVAVATIEDAMREIKQQKFDCITLDLLLGGQNGMLMLNELAYFNPDTLLIVVSGASPAVRESALGMATALHLNAAELPKPLDLASLRILLTQRLNTVCAP
jgi:two-component system chemotaxis response regulator CheY